MSTLDSGGEETDGPVSDFEDNLAIFLKCCIAW